MRNSAVGILSFFLLAFFGCGVNTFFLQDGVERLPAITQITGEPVHTVFLIGDAGEPLTLEREPTFQALIEDASKAPKNSLLIFLGDNIYPDGMPDSTAETRLISEKYLKEQLITAEESGLQTVFIPGNHDWGTLPPEGLEILGRQQDFISRNNNPDISFLPRNGSPGPDFIDLGDAVRVIILDSQWLLFYDDYAQVLPPFNEKVNHESVLDSLEQLLSTAGEREILFIMHHPLASYGQHGGFFSWETHIFPLRMLSPALWIPLPVLGSIYPWLRNNGISSQDLSNPVYHSLVTDIEKLFKQYTPLASASGHDHILQVLYNEQIGYYNLISGKGTAQHDDPVTDGEKTLYADTRAGYMKIDFYSGGNAVLSVLLPGENMKSELVFRHIIK